MSETIGIIFIGIIVLILTVAIAITLTAAWCFMMKCSGRRKKQ